MANPKFTKYGIPTNWSTVYDVPGHASQRVVSIRAARRADKPTSLSKSDLWGWRGGSQYVARDSRSYVFFDHTDGMWHSAILIGTAPRVNCIDITAAARRRALSDLAEPPTINWMEALSTPEMPCWQPMGGSRYSFDAGKYIAQYDTVLYGRQGGWYVYQRGEAYPPQISAERLYENIRKEENGDKNVAPPDDINDIPF